MYKQRFSIPISNRQRGVVLIVALIMLVVISMLAATGLRNSSSTETVSGAVRANNLALQAAEVALRTCEDDVRSRANIATCPTPCNCSTGTFACSDPTGTCGTGNVPVQCTSSGQQWAIRTNSSLTTWDEDTSSSTVYVLPSTAINQTDLVDTYRRFPECMVEVRIDTSATVAYVITARGFGPEVSAVDADRTRPQGSEAWLQTTFQLVDPSGGGGGGTGDDDDAGGDENKSD